MRAVVQRVSHASVEIDDRVHSEIERGLLILVGFEEADTAEDLDWLAHKLTALRIFSDKDDKMNLSIQETQGAFLVVSQFTLHAATKKGNRPSFIKAAKPDTAIPLYERFKESLQKISGCRVVSGIFGADMQVKLTNDGPVTILFDTKHKE